jgi:translin
MCSVSIADNNAMLELDVIAEEVRRRLVAKNAARDKAVNTSRELIRYCSLSIRASHRDEWVEADRLLAEAQRVGRELVAVARPFADVFFSGYTQDAMKELVEASVVFAIARQRQLPTPAELGVEDAAYLNGLAEAASELRRRVLDKLRASQYAEAERLLHCMDDVYGVLVTMDFPDAITGGLRRNTDLVRGVLERTRGDVTVTMRQAELMKALGVRGAGHTGEAES